MHRLLVFAAVSLLGIAGTTGAQAPPSHSGCPLHVQVTDEDGKALPKAFVFLHNELGTSRQVPLDRNGNAKTTLRAGLYDLFVSATGFHPQAQIVDLRSCKPVDLNLMMTIDSDHVQDEGP